MVYVTQNVSRVLLKEFFHAVVRGDTTTMARVRALIEESEL